MQCKVTFRVLGTFEAFITAHWLPQSNIVLLRSQILKYCCRICDFYNSFTIIIFSIFRALNMLMDSFCIKLFLNSSVTYLSLSWSRIIFIILIGHACLLKLLYFRTKLKGLPTAFKLLFKKMCLLLLRCNRNQSLSSVLVVAFTGNLGTVDLKFNVKYS